MGQRVTREDVREVMEKGERWRNERMRKRKEMNAGEEKQREEGKLSYISMRKGTFTIYWYYYPKIFTHALLY